MRLDKNFYAMFFLLDSTQSMTLELNTSLSSCSSRFRHIKDLIESTANVDLKGTTDETASLVT